jgi:hypothetical protein
LKNELAAGFTTGETITPEGASALV